MKVPIQTGFMIALGCCLATTTALMRAEKKPAHPVHPAYNTVTIINHSGSLFGIAGREALVKAQYFGTIGTAPVATRKVLASKKRFDLPLVTPNGILDAVKITDLKTEATPLIIQSPKAGTYAIIYDSKNTRWVLMKNEHKAKPVKKRN